MRTIEINIRSRAEAEEYILACEKRFNDTIDEALEGIFTHGDVKTIALAGPTCSGKTTTAEKITRRIRRAGKQAVVLSIDDFFLSRADRNVVDGEAPDYDSAAAIDLETLETFMDRLNRGLPVLVPRFDFSSAARVGYHEYIPREEDIYLFEGIQAVYPEVTRLFGPGYKSIFINVNEEKTKFETVRDNIVNIARRIEKAGGKFTQKDIEEKVKLSKINLTLLLPMLNELNYSTMFRYSTKSGSETYMELTSDEINSYLNPPAEEEESK